MTSAPSIFSLPPEERAKEYATALQRVADELPELAAEHKRREAYRDPRADYYLGWKDRGMVCILVVKHYDAANSIAVSRDGGARPHIYLPNSRVQVLEPESEGEFLLALIPRSFVSWLETKDFVAGQRFRELFGVTFPLTETREWTDEQVASWKHLDATRSNINRRIQAASTRPRKTYSKLPFGYSA